MLLPADSWVWKMTVCWWGLSLLRSAGAMVNYRVWNAKNAHWLVFVGQYSVHNSQKLRDNEDVLIQHSLSLSAILYISSSLPIPVMYMQVPVWTFEPRYLATMLIASDANHTLWGVMCRLWMWAAYGPLLWTPSRVVQPLQWKKRVSKTWKCRMVGSPRTTIGAACSIIEATWNWPRHTCRVSPLWVWNLCNLMWTLEPCGCECFGTKNTWVLCPHSALFLLVWMEHVSYIVHTGLFEDLLGSSLTIKCVPLLASLPAA